MKKISYRNFDFLYEVHNHLSEPSWRGIYTGFYSTTPEIKEKRKYLLFGPKIKVKKFTRLFDIHDFNIESPDLSKKEVEEQLDFHINRIIRKSEIERGEIINNQKKHDS